LRAVTSQHCSSGKILIPSIILPFDYKKEMLFGLVTRLALLATCGAAKGYQLAGNLYTGYQDIKGYQPDIKRYSISIEYLRDFSRMLKNIF